MIRILLSRGEEGVGVDDLFLLLLLILMSRGRLILTSFFRGVKALLLRLVIIIIIPLLFLRFFLPGMILHWWEEKWGLGLPLLLLQIWLRIFQLLLLECGRDPDLVLSRGWRGRDMVLGLSLIHI